MLSVALSLASLAISSVAHFERTPSDTAQVSAIAATYDSESQCIHVYDPLTSLVLRVEIPNPSLPEYTHCVAYLNGETFNG